MGTKRARALTAWLWTALIVTMLVAGACGEKKGALILAINTDMKAPKDVNAVSVTVSTNGAIKHSFIGRVTPDGDILLPATLAIVQPDDDSAPVRIRVMAFQDRKPRVLRDVKTTVPRDGRTALLRIPLNFVNDGSTKSAPLPDGILPPLAGGGGGGGGGGSGSSGSSGGGSGSSGGATGGGAADFDFFGSFQPDCPDFENQTWIDGECKNNSVDPGALPDYEDTLVFGTGKDGADTSSCFDVATCFQGASPIQEGSGTGGDITPVQDGGTRQKDVSPRAIALDRTTCSIALNGADASRLNLAVVTPDTGECVKPGECYIPLEQGPSGWRIENGRVLLPPVTCKLLGKGLRLFQTTAKCNAKTEAQPICRPMPPTFKCANPSFESCGKCIETNCRQQAAVCFGPEWPTGKFSGVCAPFLNCFCACSDPTAGCEQCESTFGANGCESCLNTNLDACVKQSNCPCGGGKRDDGVNVNLTFQAGNPAPTPSIGTQFSTNSGSNVSDPQQGVNARTLTATRSNDGWNLRVTTCATLSSGQSLTRLKAQSSSCAQNPDPYVQFALGSNPSNGQPGQAWTAAQGTILVTSTTPLTLQFNGLVMQAIAQTGAGGTFTLNGSGTWSASSTGSSSGSSGGACKGRGTACTLDSECCAGSSCVEKMCF